MDFTVGLFSLCSWVSSNYAIKPTPERALRTNRTMPPARLIAALGVLWGPSRSEVENWARDLQTKYID